MTPGEPVDTLSDNTERKEAAGILSFKVIYMIWLGFEPTTSRFIGGDCH